MTNIESMVIESIKRTPPHERTMLEQSLLDAYRVEVIKFYFKLIFVLICLAALVKYLIG